MKPSRQTVNFLMRATLAGYISSFVIAVFVRVLYIAVSGDLILNVLHVLFIVCLIAHAAVRVLLARCPYCKRSLWLKPTIPEYCPYCGRDLDGEQG